ncbi:hypothetical protein ACWKWA_04585 [Dermacoccus abyssi]
MQEWTVVALLLAGALAIAWYLSYTAARLDRLHARVEGSLAALDAQLVRRAEVALELANGADLDAASAFLLAAAASASLEASEGAQITAEVQEVGVPEERALIEGELTAALGAVVEDWAPASAAGTQVRRRLGDACERVELAHRFHNEAVTDVRRVRAKPVVRALHLAGRTHLPRPVEFDDHVEGLTTTSAWR